MRFFDRGPRIPVLRFQGPIGMATPLRPGLALATVAGALEKAFRLSSIPAVAIAVNSPGGSPVQSSLIFKRIRQLAAEQKKKVYVFCEDVAASGGYYLACAGDEIYADASSIVGSIGVITQSFGFVEAIDKLGIERRVYTSGANKGALDMFKPESPDDVALLKAIQRDVHDAFIGVVKDRRAGRLKAQDAELFSGAFWSARTALEHGLIDGVADMRAKMREIYGDKTRLVVVPLARGGLLSRLRRLPSVRVAGERAAVALSSPGLAFADDLVSAIETRALWSRFGL
ncbi:MAG: S49 family peptidase [Hyphomicrobiaceae bacterium]